MEPSVAGAAQAQDICHAQRRPSLWVPIVANSYAGIGEQGKAFLALMRAEASKRGRRIGGKYLEATIQSAAIYFSAVNILTAYDRAPSGVEPLVLAGGK